MVKKRVCGAVCALCRSIYYRGILERYSIQYSSCRARLCAVECARLCAGDGRLMIYPSQSELNAEHALPLSHSGSGSVSPLNTHSANYSARRSSVLLATLVCLCAAPCRAWSVCDAAAPSKQLRASLLGGVPAPRRQSTQGQAGTDRRGQCEDAVRRVQHRNVVEALG